MCLGGGIGRHDSLKNYWDFSHVGSSPTLGTNWVFYFFKLMELAETEGFEPPRALTPDCFQDSSLQPDLGISPKEMVDPTGLEPVTSPLSTERSNQTEPRIQLKKPW